LVDLAMKCKGVLGEFHISLVCQVNDGSVKKS
jgi:hypothetical protein